MEHRFYTSHDSKDTKKKWPRTAGEDWITAQQLASEYHIGRSTAYEAFKRLDTIRIGGCVRARRSEIEERLRRYGRI